MNRRENHKAYKYERMIISAITLMQHNTFNILRLPLPNHIILGYRIPGLILFANDLSACFTVFLPGEKARTCQALTFLGQDT